MSMGRLTTRLCTDRPSVEESLADLRGRGLLEHIRNNTILLGATLDRLGVPFTVERLRRDSTGVVVTGGTVRLMGSGSIMFLSTSSDTCGLVPFLTTGGKLAIVAAKVGTLGGLTRCGVGSVDANKELVGSYLSLVNRRTCDIVSDFGTGVMFFSYEKLSCSKGLDSVSSNRGLMEGEVVGGSRGDCLLYTDRGFKGACSRGLYATSSVAKVVDRDNNFPYGFGMV